MTYAIKVENLGKKYTIKHESQTRYSTLRDQLTHSARSIAHRLRHPLQPVQNGSETEQFWALKDIGFEIQPGDRVGIIGRNGAGKSTLLKILSRITAPTTGKVTINGRVASLLEVGTGFHPELSGRENIFLNGAVLGMRKHEIQKKFDEIVDFAEVEKFLDTPVKRYSSGMYVRLAFAVAAHLEPEILIVDEVLAVGDAQFQRKCLGKMEEVSVKGGRTVLFVSHNMGTVSQLCNKTILLDKGHSIKTGITSEVIDYYLQQKTNSPNKINRDHVFLGNHFQSIHMSDKRLTEKYDYRFDESIFIKIKLILPEFNDSLELAMRLIDKHKRAIFTIHEKLRNYINDDRNIDLVVKIPERFLTPGRYSWIMCINHPNVVSYDLQDDILPFTITETGSDFSRYEGADYGCVFASYSIRKI